MKAGWEPSNIGSICVVDWGNTNLTKSAFVEDGQFLAVSAAGCDGRIGHAEHDAGTPVLSAIGAQCGRMFFPSEDFTAIKNTITLTPKSGICDGKFLFHLLNHVTLPQRGAGQPFISKGDIQKFPVSIPPLDEQLRIVAVLDKAFAGIATATANAQKNLTNARALFESTIAGILAKVPNCRTISLLEAADSTCSLSYGIVQPGEEFDGGLPIVRPTDLRQKLITGKNLKSIDPSLAASYKRTTLRGDDLLLCVRGTTGTLSIATPELAGGNVTRGIVPIRFNPVVLSQELGYFLLRSASAQAQIKAATYGTALMQINIGDLKKLNLRLPKVEDQSQLADRLNSAQSSIEGLIEIQETKLTALTELKQSLLQKAFAGELT